MLILVLVMLDRYLYDNDYADDYDDDYDGD